MIPPVLTAALASDVPVLVWGPPGTGKTAALLALAEERRAHVEVLIGSTIDPVDLSGWLVPSEDGSVTQTPPPWVCRLREALDAGRETWLFLDELSCAPPSCQAALLRVVQERGAAGVSLDGCRMLAASNRAEHAADGGVLSAATANRWAHVDWRVSASAWASGLLRYWGQPAPGNWAPAAARIAGYIQAHPTALLSPPAGPAEAWSSPRSWTAAARLIALGAPTVEAVSSCVGQAAAAEWATWDTLGDLPDPEAVLAGRVAWPDRGDRILVTALAVVACAVAPHDERQARIDMAAARLSLLRRDVAIPAAAALVDAVDVVPDALCDLGTAIRAARTRLALVG